MQHGVVVNESRDEHDEKEAFREDKAADANEVLLEPRMRSIGLEIERLVGILRVRQIPQGPAAADRRDTREVVHRRWGGSSPFECPGLPGIIASRSAVTKADD